MNQRWQCKAPKIQKSFFRPLVLAVALVLPLTSTRRADAQSVSIGSDMSPWLLEGYSLMVNIEPKESNMRFGAEVWGFEFPTFALELQEGNQGEQWQQHVNVGVILYADWHFTEAWHAGLLVSGFHSTVSRKMIAGEDEFLSLEVLARGGYRWFPGKQSHFYVNPFLAAGPVISFGERKELGGEVFEEPIIQMIGTVHAGWRF